MKKILCLCLAFVMCFSLIGCDSNKNLTIEETLKKIENDGFVSWSYKLPDIEYSYLVNNNSESQYYGYTLAEYKDTFSDKKAYYFFIENSENEYDLDENLFEFDDNTKKFGNFLEKYNLSAEKLKKIMDIILEDKEVEITYEDGIYNPLDIKLKVNDKEKQLIDGLEKQIINASSNSLELVDYYKESTISSTLCLEFTSDDVEEYTYVVKYNLEHNNDDISTKIFSFEMELDSDLGASVERLQDFVNISSTLGYHDSSLNTEILIQVINGLSNRAGSSKNYQENDNKFVTVSSSHIVTSNYNFTYSGV